MDENNTEQHEGTAERSLRNVTKIDLLSRFIIPDVEEKNEVIPHPCQGGTLRIAI
jgi:hypothetical protein